MRVLVLDNYTEHLETLMSVLRVSDCEVKGSRNGWAGGMCSGLHIAKVWQPHLVVCDEELYDGVTAWQWAYEFLNFVEEAQAPRPYLVALTTHNERRAKVLCMECGYNEFVKKPLTLEIIVSWVHKAKEFVTGEEAMS